MLYFLWTRYNHGEADAAHAIRLPLRPSSRKNKAGERRVVPEDYTKKMNTSVERGVSVRHLPVELLFLSNKQINQQVSLFLLCASCCSHDLGRVDL